MGWLLHRLMLQKQQRASKVALRRTAVNSKKRRFQTAGLVAQGHASFSGDLRTFADVSDSVRGTETVRSRRSQFDVSFEI
ncbi:MAG: hypothetical protein JWO48_2924 [Bryobacterales bacterium]|nr:hypothetical protein [Bryobacterales bacterium]